MNVRTNAEQWDDAIALFKKINKYSGSMLYMLKNGADRGDSLMLGVAQTMIRALDGVLENEVHTLDAEYAESHKNETTASTNDGSNYLAEADSDNESTATANSDKPCTEREKTCREIIARYRDHHGVHSLTSLRRDCAILNCLIDKLHTNEKEGIVVTLEDLKKRFQTDSIGEITDSVIRVVCGYWKDDDGNEIIPIDGWIRVDEETDHVVFKSVYYTYVSMTADEFYEAVIASNFKRGIYLQDKRKVYGVD